MSQDLSGGTYSIVLRDLAFQICPSFWDFASCLSCSATRFGNPLRNFFPLATATNHCRKIKNPASSAGRNHSVWSGSTRCSTSFYPVLVKNPTIGSTSRLCFLGWKSSRSDRDAPERSSALSSPRTIRNDTSFSSFVKPSYQLFFPQACAPCANPSAPFQGFWTSLPNPPSARGEAGKG